MNEKHSKWRSAQIKPKPCCECDLRNIGDVSLMQGRHLESVFRLNLSSDHLQPIKLATGKKTVRPCIWTTFFMILINCELLTSFLLT